MIFNRVMTWIKVELIIYKIFSHRSPINHNSLTMTPILVVLDPTISLRRADHYYAVCSYVWCDVNFIYTMFVCIATTSSEVTSHLKIILVPGILSPRQVVPLTIFIYPIMFFIIILSCIGLILMGPNRPP